MPRTSNGKEAPEPSAPTPTAADVGSRFLRYLPIISFAHFFIGLPALIASLALAYFAFVQADATQKMQTGGAMPFVTYGNARLTGRFMTRMRQIVWRGHPRTRHRIYSTNQLTIRFG